jgi:serine/threonine protein kinase
VADFGITSEGTSRRDQPTKYARGTASYSAPELVAENPTYTNKVDIWAFGCIMVEMCKGEKAFLSDFAVHEFRVSGRKPTIFRTDEFTSNSEINTLAEKIEGWTMTILNIDPTKRPTAGDLADDLNRRIDRTTIAMAGIMS